MNTQHDETIQATWAYLTVNQFAKRHPAFTIGGLRHQIFNEDTNGLAQSGAIVRSGRKVLIKESAYFTWLDANGKGGK